MAEVPERGEVLGRRDASLAGVRAMSAKTCPPCERHGWHIDHVRPVSSFPPGTAPSVISALSNLQPLWAIDNLRKAKRCEVGSA